MKKGSIEMNMIRSLKRMIIETNIVLLAGLLPVIGTGRAFAQMPGMPYMPYVKPATIPATITLGQNLKYMMTSIYDTNYLPYTAPATAATTATLDVSSPSLVTIDVQGSVSTTGITVYIPVTATSSGTLQAYTSSPITIPAALTEDKISRDLTLSWAAQAYTSSTTAITATISAVGGTLNAKKLDINAGVGNDYQGVLIGTFSYPYNSEGATTTYQLRDIAGIPDKMFGQYDNGNTSTYEHNFIYAPVVGEDGKIWLNNNLGADYSNVNSASFSPAMQATSSEDYHAYGSLFQWGRKPDGHELITWASTTKGTPVYNTLSTTQSDTPVDAKFIKAVSDWRVTRNNDLWATETSANNPCPSGFRVPTQAEQTALVTAAGITNSDTAADSKLKFSIPGIRNYYDGVLNGAGMFCYFWSSSVNGLPSASFRYFFSDTNTSTTGRNMGLTVRCLRD